MVSALDDRILQEAIACLLATQAFVSTLNLEDKRVLSAIFAWLEPYQRGFGKFLRLQLRAQETVQPPESCKLGV